MAVAGIYGVRTKHRTRKRNISKTYDWRKFMEKHEDHAELVKQKPRFMTDKGAVTVEPWTVEMIRRKYFVDLTKDYQRDRWMPKAILFIRLALRREIINLRDLARFLGMPEGYLVSLCQRDKVFRAWVIEWREYNIEGKVEAVKDAMAIGFDPNTLKPNHSSDLNVSSFLDFIDSSFSPDDVNRDPKLGKIQYKYRIDVGWKPKTVSKKR